MTEKQDDTMKKIGILLPISLKKRLDAVLPSGTGSAVFRCLAEDLVRALEKDKSDGRDLLGLFLKRSITFTDMVKVESDPAFHRLMKLSDLAIEQLEACGSDQLAGEIQQALGELR